MESKARVRGPVVLFDADGNEFRAERATVALCRCGGTHAKIGFRAAETADREVRGVRV